MPKKPKNRIDFGGNYFEWVRIKQGEYKIKVASRSGPSEIYFMLSHADTVKLRDFLDGLL